MSESCEKAASLLGCFGNVHDRSVSILDDHIQSSSSAEAKSRIQPVAIWGHGHERKSEILESWNTYV